MPLPITVTPAMQAALRTKKHKAASDMMAVKTGRAAGGKRKNGKGKRGKRISKVSKKRALLRSSSGAAGSTDPWSVRDADADWDGNADEAYEYGEDGEPLDSDLDGEPLDEPEDVNSKPSKAKPCRTKPKAKAKAASKPKPKAKAKAYAKAKAKAASTKKAATCKPKAKPMPAKGKRKSKGSSSVPEAGGSKGSKRRSRAPDDRFQLEAHATQKKVWLGTRWIFQILPDQKLGCPSCRFIYNGCSHCEKPGFRGMSAAKMREDPDYVWAVEAPSDQEE